jgi:hypothetical protein
MNKTKPRQRTQSYNIVTSTTRHRSREYVAEPLLRRRNRARPPWRLEFVDESRRQGYDRVRFKNEAASSRTFGLA